MFLCQHCGTPSKLHEKPVRVIVKERQVNYPYRREAHRTPGLLGVPEYKDDPGGSGYEIAKEIIVHEHCAPR